MRFTKTRTLIAFALVAIGTFSVSAQNASYMGVDGSRYETASDKGKVVVLAIGARWLPLSETQAEVLGKVMKSLKGKDVVFYFVATDTIDADADTSATDAELTAFAKKNKIEAKLLRDPRGNATTKAYKVDQLPAFVIIDKQGNIQGRPVTGIQPNRDISPQLTQRIESLL